MTRNEQSRTTHELYGVSVEPQRFTDHSLGWNVEQTTDHGKVVFACVDKPHADRLAAELVRCSWVEITVEERQS